MAEVPVFHHALGLTGGVPVQIHAMDADPFFVDDGDRDAALALLRAAPQAKLFLHQGRQHLFAEPGQPSYDAGATAVMTRRVPAFPATR